MAPQNRPSLREYDSAEGLREGLRVIFSLKIYAQHGLRFVKPVSEPSWLNIFVVHPFANPTDHVPKMFPAEPDLDNVKHG
jgi:hypothetical protein